jgi:hypothetical protein
LNLVVPYQEPVVKGEVTDFSSTMSSTLPMAAMFMRNKFVGWYAILGPKRRGIAIEMEHGEG